MASIEKHVKGSNDADPEMERILEEMLEADDTITARAVARILRPSSLRPWKL